MALGVVILDVREVRRVLESGNVPVQMSQPAVDVRVTAADISDIGLDGH
jgi:hypothetical protein